jgi:hypothetical protein
MILSGVIGLIRAPPILRTFGAISIDAYPDFSAREEVAEMAAMAAMAATALLARR